MMKEKMVWKRRYLNVCEIFDLWKQYPLWIRSALWIVGAILNKRCLEIALVLHEKTEYKVRGKEGVSEGWMLYHCGSERKDEGRVRYRRG